MRFTIPAAATLAALLPGALSCFIVDVIYNSANHARMYGYVLDNHPRPICSIHMQGAMHIKHSSISGSVQKEIFEGCESLTCLDPNIWRMSICRRRDLNGSGEDTWQLYVDKFEEEGLGGWTSRSMELEKKKVEGMGIRLVTAVWGCTESDKEAYTGAKMGVPREQGGEVPENPEYFGPTPGINRRAVQF